MTDHPKPKLIIFAKVCIAIVLAAIVTHTLAVVITGASVRKAKAAIVEKGYPMTAAEITPKPVPDDQNAALELKKIFGLLTLGSNDPYSPGKSGGNLVAPFTEFNDVAQFTDSKHSFETPYSEKTLKELETMFNTEEFQQVFALLTAASKKGRCYFERDYDAGPTLLLPEISHLRNIVRLLSARAKYEAQRGNKELAFEKARESLILANSLADEPILISQLVRLACLHVSIQGVLVVSNLHPLTEAEIASIKELSMPFRDTVPLERSFHGERILMGQWCFELEGDQNKIAEMIDSETGLKFYASYPLRPLYNMDYTSYLEMMMLHSHQFNDDLKTSFNEDAVFEEHVGKFAVLTKMLLPTLDAVRFKLGGAKAVMQMAELGIACNQYKHKNGSYPKSLNVIASGADLVDASTGKAFAYQTTPDGAIVYSQFDKYRGGLTVGDNENVLGVKLLK